MILPVLTYHSILYSSQIEQMGLARERIYTLDVFSFERQLSFLHKGEYSVLDFDDICEHLDAKHAEPRKGVVLTFDDGRVDNYNIAYTVLKKYNFKATFFISTSLIGQDGYLNWQQIREMSSYGMSFQSHTHTHCMLSELGYDEVKRELVLSKRIIEDKLQKDVSILALPHGRENNFLKELASSAGYRFVCTSEWGYNVIDEDTFFIMRLPIKNGNSMHRFSSFVEMNRSLLFYYRMKKLPFNLAKKVLGFDCYNKLRNKILR